MLEAIEEEKTTTESTTPVEGEKLAKTSQEPMAEVKQAIEELESSKEVQDDDLKTSTTTTDLDETTSTSEEEPEEAEPKSEAAGTIRPTDELERVEWDWLKVKKELDLAWEWQHDTENQTKLATTALSQFLENHGDLGRKFAGKWLDWAQQTAAETIAVENCRAEHKAQQEAKNRAEALRLETEKRAKALQKASEIARKQVLQASREYERVRQEAQKAAAEAKIKRPSYTCRVCGLISDQPQVRNCPNAPFHYIIDVENKRGGGQIKPK